MPIRGRNSTSGCARAQLGRARRRVTWRDVPPACGRGGQPATRPRGRGRARAADAARVPRPARRGRRPWPSAGRRPRTRAGASRSAPPARPAGGRRATRQRGEVAEPADGVDQPRSRTHVGCRNGRHGSSTTMSPSKRFWTSAHLAVGADRDGVARRATAARRASLPTRTRSRCPSPPGRCPGLASAVAAQVVAPARPVDVQVNGIIEPASVLM